MHRRRLLAGLLGLLAWPFARRADAARADDWCDRFLQALRDCQPSLRELNDRLARTPSDLQFLADLPELDSLHAKRANWFLIDTGKPKRLQYDPLRMQIHRRVVSEFTCLRVFEGVGGTFVRDGGGWTLCVHRLNRRQLARLVAASHGIEHRRYETWRDGTSSFLAMGITT